MMIMHLHARFDHLSLSLPPFFFLSPSVATDLSLTALMNAEISQAQTHVHGMALALCCRHLCAWSSYVNQVRLVDREQRSVCVCVYDPCPTSQDFVRDAGFTRQEFEQVRPFPCFHSYRLDAMGVPGGCSRRGIL